LTSIFIIAGEASGDVLGHRLMTALHNRDSSIAFSGIGGARMAEAGLSSLFPMQELAHMGLIEILPRVFPLLRRIKQTIAAIREQKPDILVTIDSPGLAPGAGKTFPRAVGGTALPAPLRARFLRTARPPPGFYGPPRAGIRR